MGGAAGAVVGAAGCGDRDAGGESRTSGDGEADRVFCEHAGAAGGCVGTPSVGELLEQVKEEALGAQQHQDMPFEQVVEMVQPERSLTHSPLFQVMFAWQNAPEERLELPGLEVRALRVGVAAGGEVRSDAVAAGGGREDCGRGGVRDSAVRASDDGAVGGILAEAAGRDGGRDGRDRLIDCRMLSEEEREQVLEGWNETKAEYPERASVCMSCSRSRWRGVPEAVAVVYEEEELSYEELNRRANQLAHYLQELGVKPEERVGICVERGGDGGGAAGDVEGGRSVCAAGSGVSGGAAAVHAGGQRAVVLLTQAHLRRAVMGELERSGGGGGLESGEGSMGGAARGESGARRDWSRGEASGVRDLHLGFDGSAQGSDGRARERGEAVCRRRRVQFEFGEQDVWTLFHSYAFDFSVWELWGALLYGGRLVVVPQGVSAVAGGVLRVGVRRRGDGAEPDADRVPATDGGGEERGAGESDGSCGYVIFGGEALEVSELAGLVRAATENERPQLVNMYGITETTVHVTYR